MKTIKTIADYLKARREDPGLLREVSHEATVLDDYEEYLRWLDQEEVTTTVVTRLERKKSRALGIHPSSVCKKDACLLKIYYECTLEIEPSRAYEQDQQNIWDLGTLIHCWLQTNFESMYGNQFSSEVSLEDTELHMIGHADGVFDFSQVSFVLEIKSIKEGGNFGWAKIQDAPFDDNIRQAHCYMWMSDIPFSVIMYVCKNNGGIKEHTVCFDQEIWSDIRLNTIEPVIKAVYNNGPMVDANPGWHCRYCQFQHGCPEISKRNSSHVKGSGKPWAQKRA